MKEVVLVMFKADGTRRDFAVTGDHMTIGRKNSCDLRIPLSSVSRQHCEIRVEDDAVSVNDLGSSNGTFVNDERMDHKVLEPGDSLIVGPVVFTLLIDGEPKNVKPIRTLLATQGAGTGSSDVEDEDQDASGLTAVAEIAHPDATQIADEQELLPPLESMGDDDDDFEFGEVELAELDEEEK